jgi:cobalt-zinc-cadmium efflux system membrane fusion protein
MTMNRILPPYTQRALRLRAWLKLFSSAVMLALIAGAPGAAAQTSDKDWVSVQLQLLTPHVEAYGQVEPISLLPINAAQAGVVADLHVLPGTRVHAGQLLAHLNGPSLRSLQMQSEADLRSAQSQLSTAQKSLAIQQQQLQAHLSTREAVHQAESSIAQAQTAVDNAQSRLGAVRQMATLSAPTDAIVLALNSANGEWVNMGQTIVTLQPSRSLWVRATFFGTDMHAVHVGMTGRFRAADGTTPTAVKVAGVYGSITAGSGESVAVVPLHPQSQWLNGEAGTVTLDAPERRLVAVPTRALIVHQGSWWVLVHTPQGDHPQAVVPGPAEGWNTFIESGLAPGAQVVVNNAYLLFHSSIAEQYQIPD